MITCNWKKYSLNFINPGGTSRGILHKKETWIIILADDSLPGKIAFGECGMFRDLSCDDRPEFEQKLNEVCRRLPLEGAEILKELQDWPAILFGVEMLLRDWKTGAQQVLFESDFTKGKSGIDINGLIWMGSKDYMLQQIKQKLTEGFSCLKMKIGAIDFENELEILGFIRKQFNPEEIEIRVDANGAFPVSDALSKIDRLSKFHIHSIEQPIKAGQLSEMANLVSESAIPIALDEELIGVNESTERQNLIETIKPPYIILKPTLVGGFSGSEEWMNLIEKAGGDWWITSALESNIGLNAIAQFVSTKNNDLPQGLGTGKLYSNNIDSPLKVKAGKIFLDQKASWDFSRLDL